MCVTSPAHAFLLHSQLDSLVQLTCRAEAGWFNSGYIFLEGFTSRVNFRSSVVLDALCVHECSILGEEGQYWPAATFRVTSMDRAEEPLYAKSCTGCWSQVRLTQSNISCMHSVHA